MTPTEDPVALEPAAPPLARRLPDPPRAEVNGELRDRVKKLRIGGPGDDDGGKAKGSFLGRVAWLPWLLCGVLALAWAGVAIRTYKAAPANANTAGGGPAPAGSPSGGGNSGGASTPTPGAIKLEQRGTLVIARQISVSPIDVGGRIIDLRGPTREADIALVGGVSAIAPVQSFTEGALYKKGDVIAILDGTSYQAQVDEATQALVSAERGLEAAHLRFRSLLAQLEQAEASLAQAKETYKLKKDGNGTKDELNVAGKGVDIATGRLNEVRANLGIEGNAPVDDKLKARHPDINKARAEVAAAVARLAQTQWRVDNCTIRAPISGTVLTKSAELGKLVNPMAFSGGGAVCDLGDLGDLEAELKVAERDIRKVEVGQACQIVMDAFPDRKYAGTVTRVMPIATRSDNTVGVRVKVKLKEGEIPGTFLKPEMGGVVTIRE